MSAPAVYTVEVAPGVVVSSESTPAERGAVIARAMGAAPVATRPGGITFGPREADGKQAHTDGTVGVFAQRDAMAAQKAAPPPGQTDPTVVLPPQGTPAERAAGKVAAPPVAAPDAPTVDQSAVDALNARWREIAPGLTDAVRSRFRAIYERDMRSLMEGRRTGESITDFYARLGKPLPGLPGEHRSDADSLAPKPSKAEAKAAAKAAAPSQFTPEQWTTAHESVADKDGFIPAERINAAGLSGYTLPKLLDGQTYHKSVFAQLATARAAGISQAQVDSFISAQMKADGWLK